MFVLLSIAVFILLCGVAIIIVGLHVCKKLDGVSCNIAFIITCLLFLCLLVYDLSLLMVLIKNYITIENLDSFEIVKSILIESLAVFWNWRLDFVILLVSALIVFAFAKFLAHIQSRTISLLPARIGMLFTIFTFCFFLAFVRIRHVEPFFKELEFKLEYIDLIELKSSTEFDPENTQEIITAKIMVHNLDCEEYQQEIESIPFLYYGINLPDYRQYQINE